MNRESKIAMKIAGDMGIGRLLGNKFKFVSTLSKSPWIVFAYYGSGTERRIRFEVENALAGNIDYRSIDVRNDGIARQDLDTDTYVIVELP